jgi:D-3-phosphoglycerate dehydrogenase
MILKKVLITDKVHPYMIEAFQSCGWQVDYDTSVDNAMLERIIHQFDGIIINSKIIMDRQKMDKAIQLKFIGRLGSGMEIIDIKYAKKHGIAVYNAPEGNSNAVAEHELGMILSLLNRICVSNREIRNFDWKREQNRGRELSGKTVGIIGLGHTGAAFAEKLSSWRLRVISYDKYRKRYPSSLRFVEKTDLQTVMTQSDIISLHLPLTEETKYLVNAQFLEQCKDGVIISNTSRGKVVETLSLIKALQNGKVSGICLDVFENEKPETFTKTEKEMYSALYQMKNVILTPHIAGWTHESLLRIAEVLFEKIRIGNHL